MFSYLDFRFSKISYDIELTPLDLNKKANYHELTQLQVTVGDEELKSAFGHTMIFTSENSVRISVVGKFTK